MRQAFAARRQAMLFLAGHFAECARVAVGKKHRIVAETLRRRAAATPACRRRAPRTPRDGRRARRRTAPRRNAPCAVPASLRRARAAARRCAPSPAGNPCSDRPSAPNRCRARRRARRPRGRNRRRTPADLAARAAACALMRALAAKGRAGLVRLGEAEFAGRHRLDAIGREQLAHLDELAGIVGRDHQPPGDAAVRDADDAAGALTSPPSFAGRRACRRPCARARAARATAPR